jgi:hypothetical protein
MRSLEISKGSRYVDEREIRFWLEASPLCRRLEPEEERRPGDIGTLYYKIDPASPASLVHVFVFLSDKLSFQKDGPDPVFTYGFRNPENTWFLRLFRTLSKPECYRPATPEIRATCDGYFDFFRCSKLEQPPGPINSQDRMLWDELAKLEVDLSGHLLFEKPLPTPHDLILKRLEAIQNATTVDYIRLKANSLWSAVSKSVP